MSKKKVGLHDKDKNSRVSEAAMETSDSLQTDSRGFSFRTLQNYTICYLSCTTPKYTKQIKNYGIGYEE